MKITKLYRGRTAITFDPEEHCYLAAVAEKPPLPVGGVTSIIKETLGTSSVIANWMLKQCHDHLIDSAAHWVQLDFDGNEFIRVPRSEFEKACKAAKGAHRKTSKSATDIGSEVHKFAELTLKGENPKFPTDPQARAAAEAFLRWLKQAHLEVIEVERIIFSEKWWYAGTCDFYGKINGKLCVLDLKTSSGLYREMPLQLAAYSVALEEEHGLPIEDGWIIRLDKKTGEFEAHHIPLTKRLKDDWLLVRGTQRALTRTEDLVKDIKENHGVLTLTREMELRDA